MTLPIKKLLMKFSFKRNRSDSYLCSTIVCICLAVCSSAIAEEFYEEDAVGNVNQRNIGVFKSNRFDDSSEKPGRRVNKNVALNNYSKLTIELPVTITYQSGNNARAVLSGPEQVLQNVHLIEKGGRLIIRGSNFRSSQPVSIALYGNDLSQVYVHSPADVEIQAVQAQAFQLSVNGAADVAISGQAQHCRIDMQGAADLELADLRCNTVTISSLGTSDATVYASKRISGLAQGAGDLTVLGSPDERDIRALGAYDLTYD